MLTLPSRIPRRPGSARRGLHSHASTPAGWALLRSTAPERTTGQLLSALVAVLFHRYAANCRLVADQDCGDIASAWNVLDASPLDATWSEVLAAVSSSPGAVAPTEPTEVPVVLVTEDLVGPHDGVDLVWSADHDGVVVQGDAAAYSDETLAAMAGHLGRLAAVLASDEAPPLSQVCFLTEEELVVNGGTPGVLPQYPPTTLHELFMAQARRTPEACAVRADAGQLSYRELDWMSSRLAHRLVEAGVLPGDRVAVGGERTLGLFAALVAVLKAGGVFVYLDPAYPAMRLRQFMEVSSPRARMTGPGAVQLPIDLPDVPFQGVPVATETAPCDPPDVAVGAEDPSYVMFTSGSTGQPKGVLRSHRLHTSRIFLEQEMYPLSSSDRVLVKSMVSSREVFWPLTVGATLVVARPRGERDDQYLVDLIQAESVSVLPAAPGVWLQAFVINPKFAECGSLRHIFCGGEPLHRHLEEKVRAHGYAVHNTYTQTEADYILHRSGPPGPDAGEYSVMGTFLDMRVYLCDEYGRLVAPGLVGEMWTGGPGLSSGYCGDESRTAERFVPNPFNDPQVPVLCRTGDLARHLLDGMLEYRGRRDLQVKVRGQRLEPSEVESWIKQHPKVRNTVVVGYPDREHGAVLAAFVVLTDAAVTNAELRTFLAERIPDFMIPSYFVRLPEVPILANGKVDRAALKLPERSRPPELPPVTAPVTATQQRLLRLWQQVLQMTEIGVDDDYLSVGGDSLRVLLLRAAIQEEFQVSVELALLLSSPTIRAQEAMLAAAGSSAPAARQGLADEASAERERRATLRAGLAAQGVKTDTR